MKNVLFLLGAILCVIRLNAQLPAGAPAPDFTVLDINGTSYNLYSKMGSKAACIDFSATWCGVCWNFHNSGILKNIYNNLAADATAVFLEADHNTNTNCLYGQAGCNGTTQGDWVTGEPYPIVDLSPANGPNVKSNYAVTYYPTVYVISPDKRAWEVRTLVYQEFVNWITKSFKLLATGNVSHASCGANGKVNLSVSGGHGTLNYLWSNGSTTKDLSDVAGGSYSVTITDANGYFKSFGPWIVNNPPKMVDITSELISHVKCFGQSNGQIEIEASFGTPPYTYYWSNGNSSKKNSMLGMGNYTLTVTDNASCSVVKSYSVQQPTKLSLTATSNKEVCDGMNGSINVKALGGTPGYQYDIGLGKQQTSLFSALKGGKDYHVTLTDDNLCTETLKVTVDVTHKPIADAGPATDFVNCFSDSLVLDGSKSNKGPGVFYQWTTANGRILHGAKTLYPSINSTGTYFILVSDTLSKCVNSDSIIVNDLRVYPNISTSDDTLLHCKLTELVLTGNSDSLPVLYYWKKLQDSSFYEQGKFITVSDSGAYVFHVQDTLNNCISKDTVLIEKNQEIPLAMATAQHDVSCIHTEVIIDGSASTHGTNIRYLWTTTNGHILSGENTDKVLVDAGGDYKLVVENVDNYCSDELTISLIQQTQPLVKFTQVIDELNVDFTDLTEGHPTYWNWDFGDPVSPDNHSAKKDPVHLFTAAGDYVVCLEVENDCGKDKKCQTIKVGSIPALQLVSSKLRHLKCFGDRDGSIELSIEGGVPPYTFEWNTRQTTKDLDSLTAGTYSVIITDQQGTMIADSFDISQPDDIIVSNASITNTIAGSNTGVILLSLKGGVSPFSFIWSNGQTNNPIDSLATGEYHVIVTDNNGCKKEFGPFKVDELTGSQDDPSYRNDVVEIKLIPNPVSENGFIHVQLNSSAAYQIDIMNVLGKIMWSQSFQDSGSWIPVDLNAYSRGVYFVVVKTKDLKRISKWIIK